MDLDDRSTAIRFLIHDRDTKFVGPFDEVFRSEGAKVILTPKITGTSSCVRHRGRAPPVTIGLWAAAENCRRH